jgi:hypothetical protein
MPANRVLVWNQFHGMMWHHHDDLKWRHKHDTCLRAYGFMELNLSTMKHEWIVKLTNAVERGVAAVQNPPWCRILTYLCVFGEVPYNIGYLGRQEGRLYYPKDKVEGYVEQLNACYQLESGTRNDAFRIVGESDENQSLHLVRVKLGQRRTGQGTAPEARFTRLRQIVKSQLDECRYHRQEFIDYVRSMPFIKIPFSSHDSDWKRR